jgi:hypothetical protein
MTTDESVAYAPVKLASVWAAVGITSWSEAASAAAFVYTICLICHLAWKTLKPWAAKRKDRRCSNSE